MNFSRVLRSVSLALAFTVFSAVVLPSSNPLGPSAAQAATANVWPRLGTTVTMDDGTVVGSGGATLTLTTEVLTKLRSGILLTYNPSAGGSTSPPALSTLGSINVLSFGATNNDTVDDSAAIASAFAISQITGQAIYFPAGAYYVNTTVRMIPSSYTGSNGKGARIYGDGILATIFYNGVANGPMFDVDASDDADHTPFRSTMGVEFKGFSIRKSSTAPAASTGIRLRTAYHVKIDQVHIDDMSQDGLEILCSLGDVDASINVVIENSRIENCDRWGIKADSASAANELSYLTIRNTQLQGNGTAPAAVPPTSGGMIWKGQMLMMQQSGFTVNEQVSLYIKGDSGLGLHGTLDNVTFENTKGIAWYITGISQLKARNISFHQSVSAYVATYGLRIDGNPSGTSYIVRDIDIDGVVMRVGSSNPGYTAFSLANPGSTVETIRVRNVWWQQFSDTSYTRFTGFHFDHAASDCSLQIVNNQIVRYHPIAGKGNVSPLRMRGAGSTSGEWIGVPIAVNGESLATTTGSGPEVPATDLEGNALAPSTRYYVYYWDNNGVYQLSFSTTAPTIDTTHGYMVRTGDATRLYVGSVITTSAASPNIRIETAGVGWLNPSRVSASQTGADAYTWTDVNGDPRIKSTAPTSDLDGSVAGGRILTATLSSHDPASIAAGGVSSGTTVTVTGAALGDNVTASFSLDTQGLLLFPVVSAANTVTFRFYNPTNGAVDLSTGNVKVRVTKAP